MPFYIDFAKKYIFGGEGNNEKAPENYVSELPIT